MAENSYDTPTRKSPRPSRAGESEFPDIQAGRYKLICVIGTGGAGTVYKAHDTSLDKVVAIKKLHSASQDQVIRFQREARLAGSLKHDNVMSAIDFGITEKNEPYLILDYFDGESLATLIKNAGRLPVTDALPILTQIADGLEHAHKNGVIHRDIKPSNVILVDAGSPQETHTEDEDSKRHRSEARIAKIVDFGLSKSVHDDQMLTEAGIGTPKYMSPEHAHAKQIDERSDVYSFGCLMFETLTGRVPFVGASAVETINMHLSAAPAPTIGSHGGVDCSESLEKIVATCLEKDPDLRFQSFQRIGDLLALELEQVNQNVTSGKSDRSGSEPDLASQRDSESPASMPLSPILMNIGVVSAIVLMVSLILMAIPMLLTRNDSDQTAANKPAQHKQRNAEYKEFDTIKYVFGDGAPEARIHPTEIIGGGKGKQISEALFLSDDAKDKDIEEFFESNHANKRALKFDLADSTLTSHGFEVLAKNTKMSKLEYCSKPINAKTISNVLRLQHLVDLKLGGTSEVVPESLSALSQLPDLRILNLGRAPLSERAFDAIAKIKALRVLELTSCTGLNSNSLKHLLKLKDLVELKMDGTDVTDEGLVVLIKHPRLTRLSLKRTSVSDAFLEQLQSYPDLSFLDVRDAIHVTKGAVDRLRLSLKKQGKTIPVVEFGDASILPTED